MPKLTLSRSELRFLDIFTDGAILTMSKQGKFLQKYNLPPLLNIKKKIEIVLKQEREKCRQIKS